MEEHFELFLSYDTFDVENDNFGDERSFVSMQDLLDKFTILDDVYFRGWKLIRRRYKRFGVDWNNFCKDRRFELIFIDPVLNIS